MSQIAMSFVEVMKHIMREKDVATFILRLWEWFKKIGKTQFLWHKEYRD